MKHLEPLMTYLPPWRTAVVRMPETSEPASGSVRQNDASLKSSVSIPRYCFLSSSEPASASGALARPLAPSEVPMPEQPQESSSSISAPSRYEAPGPPYSSGVWTFIRPSSHALRRMSSGQVPSRSYSQATGRISFSAKSCAISRRAFCSSVSVKSTIGFSSSQIDWSVNSYGKGTYPAGCQQERSGASGRMVGLPGQRQPRMEGGVGGETERQRATGVANGPY